MTTRTKYASFKVILNQHTDIGKIILTIRNKEAKLMFCNKILIILKCYTDESGIIQCT